MSTSRRALSRRGVAATQRTRRASEEEEDVHHLWRPCTRLDVDDALDALGKAFVASRLPHTAGWLSALSKTEPVTPRHLGVPSEIIWRVDSRGDRAFLHSTGRPSPRPGRTFKPSALWLRLMRLSSRHPRRPSADHKCRLAQPCSMKDSFGGDSATHGVPDANRMQLRLAKTGRVHTHSLRKGCQG